MKYKLLKTSKPSRTKWHRRITRLSQKWARWGNSSSMDLVKRPCLIKTPLRKVLCWTDTWPSRRTRLATLRVRGSLKSARRKGLVISSLKLPGKFAKELKGRTVKRHNWWKACMKNRRPRRTTPSSFKDRWKLNLRWLTMQPELVIKTLKSTIAQVKSLLNQTNNTSYVKMLH